MHHKIALFFRSLLLLLLISSGAFAGVSSPPLQLRDESLVLPTSFVIDCQGTGILCDFNGGTGRWQIQVDGAASGTASTANALAADGVNCNAGEAPLGIDASGQSQDCYDVATQVEIDAHAAATSVHGATATPTASRIVLGTAGGKIDPGWLPLPTASTLGGVLTGGNCNATTGKQIGTGTDGLPVCGVDQNTGSGGVAGVESFKGRIGVVLPATDDYTSLQVGNVPFGTLAATDVQTALNELDTEKATTGSVSTNAADIAAHLADTTSAHLASAIGSTPAGTLSATDVQAGLDELDTEKATTGSVTTVASNLAAHLADTVDAHLSSAIGNTPFGTVSATNVQTALNELDTEKATTGSVSTVASDLSTHAAVTNAHSATATPTASRIVLGTAGGKIDAGWLPLPGALALGGVLSGGNCNATTGKQIGTGTDGLPVCGVDQNTGTVGSQTLQDVAVLGRSVTDAIDLASAVCLGGLTNKHCLYGNDTEGAVWAIAPSQSLNFVLTTGQDMNIKDSIGDPIVNFDNDTKAAAFSGPVSFGQGTTAGEIRLLEGSGAGTMYVGLRAPASRSTTLNFVYPSADPTVGQVMVWSAPSSGVTTGTWAANASGGTTLTDSASLRSALSDENGTGAALFSGAISPAFTTPAVSGSQTITGGTVTSSTPFLDMTQTWNSSGVTFTGIKTNVTDTASATQSSLMDLQTAGTSQFFARKDGWVAAGGVGFGATNFEVFTSGQMTRTGGNRNVILLAIAGAGLNLGSGNTINWSSGLPGFTAGDLVLWRDAAATLQLGTDAATATAQAIKAHDGVGADKAGADLILAGGNPTGTGTGSKLIFKTTAAGGSTSSTPQASVAWAQIPSDGGLQYLTGTRPTCDATHRGTVFYVAGGGGVADTHESCVKDAADVYAWSSLPGGGSGTPGGSTTQLQYNNAGAFGGITGATTNGTALTLVAPVLGTPASATLTNATGLPAAGVVGTAAILGANTFTGSQTVTGGTVTASTPVLDMTQTWNSSGVTFTGIKANFTNTASAVGSLAMDLQIDGATKFSVRRDGLTVVGAQLNVANAVVGSGDIRAGAAGSIYWDSDLLLYRHAAAMLQLGADAATATGQTIKAHDGVGADKAGADLTLASGNPTGSGAQGSLKFKTAYPGTTSSTQQTATDRMIIAPAKTLTDAATSLFEIALTAGAMTGGTIEFTIEASDGTDMQSLSNVCSYSAVNKAGTYTKAVTCDTANEAKSVSSGTLTASLAFLDSTNKVILQVTPAGSLTETTYRISYILKQNSPRAITLL